MNWEKVDIIDYENFLLPGKSPSDGLLLTFIKALSHWRNIDIFVAADDCHDVVGWCLYSCFVVMSMVVVVVVVVVDYATTLGWCHHWQPLATALAGYNSSGRDYYLGNHLKHLWYAFTISKKDNVSIAWSCPQDAACRE